MNPNFNSYFTEEILRNLDIRKIHWTIIPSLGPLGETIPGDSNSPPHFYCIALRRYPIVPDDEFIIAHELGHCGLNEINFPIVEPDRHLATDMPHYVKRIFNAFNSMIYDKLVNAKLKRYQINLCVETRYPSTVIENNWDSIYKVFRYVIERRSAHLLIDTNPDYERDLLSWYSENLSDIKVMGDEIFEIIEESCENSPEEIFQIIQRISSLFHWRAERMRNSTKIWIRHFN
jgi:hypothetical protein